MQVLVDTIHDCALRKGAPVHARVSELNPSATEVVLWRPEHVMADSLSVPSLNGAAARRLSAAVRHRQLILELKAKDGRTLEAFALSSEIGTTLEALVREGRLIYE